MTIMIIKIVVLLCVLIIPLRGPSKRREGENTGKESITVNSNYGINEYGEIEKIFNKNEGK